MLPDFTPVDEAIAYSYVRFSHPDQAKGDSLRRQVESALEWCKRNKARLDTSLTLHDLGHSAYTGTHRKNPDRHALALFLKLCEDGPGRRIPRGACLIVESLDRLTREHIRPALTLLLNLIEAGIRIVQLKPVEVIYDENVEPMQLMMALMELSRGNSESAMKSERVGSAWQEKKRRARSGEPQKETVRMGKDAKAVTRRLPCWLRWVDGKVIVDQQAKAAIRSIFRWAIDGYGIGVITKKLNAENVIPIGRGKRASDKWARSYVAKILDNRAVVGEYQPYTGRGEARRTDGEPIPNYYPVVITEEEWNAAKAALASRRGKPGRPAKHGVNIWSGLLRCARDGGTMQILDKGARSGFVVVPYNAVQGVRGSVMASFPFVTFDEAVLKLLREVDPKDILEGANGHDEVMALEGEHGQLEAAIASLSAELDTHGESPTLYARLRAKEKRFGEVVALLGDARQRAANPLSGAWGETKNLAKLAHKAREAGDTDTLLRLRAQLRRVIDSIWILVVPRGLDRLAAVQIWFHGGGNHRDYLILHRPAKGNASARRPAKWMACSLSDVAQAGNRDLRKPADARKLEALLSAVDLKTLVAAMKQQPGLKHRRKQT